MLIRLLVVVLTLVGPMPFRVCTCAAGVPVQTTSGAPAVPAPKSCGCERCPAQPAPVAEVTPTPDHADSPSDHADRSHQTPNQQDRHERDCPATNPTPVVRDAVVSSAADAPTDCVGSGSVVWVTSSQLLPAFVVRPPASPRATKLPLYITLLSIQN